MTFQRRLAIVPGADMLSPEEAQRILAEHQFPDNPRSHNYHQGDAWEPTPSPSPKSSRKLRLQIPQQNQDLYLSKEIRRHDDGHQHSTFKRQSYKQDIHSKNSCHDVHEGRKARDRGHQKLDTDGHAHKKREQVKDSTDDHRRHFTTDSEDVLSVSEIGSEGAKQHKSRDTLRRVEARTNLREVGKYAKAFKHHI